MRYEPLMKRVSVRFKGVQKRIQGALILGIGLQLARNSGVGLKA